MVPFSVTYFVTYPFSKC